MSAHPSSRQMHPTRPAMGQPKKATPTNGGQPIRPARPGFDDVAKHPGKLKHLEATLRRNQASDYTERLVKLGAAFDYEEERHHPWNPETCSILYGTPLWEQADASQRLALGHLYWAAFYSMVAAAETSACVWNEVAAGALFAIPEFDTACHELDLETSQERHHVHTFATLTQRTEAALIGRPLFQRILPHYTQAASTHPNKNGRWDLPAQIPGHVLTAYIGNSPFVATQYFVGRGLRNIAGRHKEGRTVRYARQLRKANEHIPAATAISDLHFKDEAFHTATSNIIGKEGWRSFPKPTRQEKWMVNMLIGVVQAVDNTLSATVPVMFREDRGYMPAIYQLLRSDVFNLDHNGALEMMAACYTQESEALYLGLRCLEATRKDGQDYLADLPFLWGANRELKAMGLATISRAVTRNTKALKSFKRQMAKQAHA